MRLREDGDDVGKLSSQPFRPPGSEAVDDHFVLDFDGAGHLVGIEFLTPEGRLLPSVLAAAERSTPRPRA